MPTVVLTNSSPRHLPYCSSFAMGSNFFCRAKTYPSGMGQRILQGTGALHLASQSKDGLDSRPRLAPSTLGRQLTCAAPGPWIENLPTYSRGLLKTHTEERSREFSNSNGEGCIQLSAFKRICPMFEHDLEAMCSRTRRIALRQIRLTPCLPLTNKSPKGFGAMAHKSLSTISGESPSEHEATRVGRNASCNLFKR